MEEILSVIIINQENLAEAKRLYEAKVLASVPGAPIEFKIGMVIVTQTIHTDDLFASSFKCTQENIWLATRNEFDAKFNMVDDGNKTDTFAIITRK
jgi:hypothetical protein